MPPVPYVPAMPRRSARRDHLIVCGDNSLATRVIEELTTTYGQQVTVLLRTRSGGLAPKIAALPRVRVIERPELDSDAFAAAGVQSARSLALLGQDDLGNFHCGTSWDSPSSACSRCSRPGSRCSSRLAASR